MCRGAEVIKLEGVHGRVLTQLSETLDPLEVPFPGSIYGN